MDASDPLDSPPLEYRCPHCHAAASMLPILDESVRVIYYRCDTCGTMFTVSRTDGNVRMINR